MQRAWEFTVKVWKLIVIALFWGFVLLCILISLALDNAQGYIPESYGGTPRPPTPTLTQTPVVYEPTGAFTPLPTITPRPPTPTLTPRPPTPTAAIYDPCNCDCDFDGDIDIVDIQCLAAQWGTSGCIDFPVLWYGTPEF
jgi:hypothetical protein